MGVSWAYKCYSALVEHSTRNPEFKGWNPASDGSRQGILKGEVSLYHWPPVWLVRNQLYDNWHFWLLFAKQTIPNQSNRRSTVHWYFPLQYSLLQWRDNSKRAMNFYWRGKIKTVGLLILTRLDQLLFENMLLLFNKTSYLYEEFNCTVPSPFSEGSLKTVSVKGLLWNLPRASYIRTRMSNLPRKLTQVSSIDLKRD
jgi:hypothetical protein